ncbi:hypothetical protein [Halomicrococcus sp. NG-SE-24]|uniref:hypothetical protein n=1 Tax=Halomicrococcus sp. NG-SE-24 TaxID=3436928 RepID=UPI003D959B9B
MEAELTRRAFAQSMAGAVAVAAVGPAAVDEDGTTSAGTADVTPVDAAFTPSEWDVVGPFQYQRRGSRPGGCSPGAASPPSRSTSRSASTRRAAN